MVAVKLTTAVYDPDTEKRALEAKHCDPAVREPVIAALASVERLQR
jgi:hypothetical protein